MSIQSKIRRFRRQGPSLLALALANVVACTGLIGCAHMREWVAPGVADDYQHAETLQHRTGKPLVIVYLDSRAPVDKPMRTALKDKEVKARMKNVLQCRLFRSCEPDRRYVDQFKVVRAPSLIYVQPNGSYHVYSDAAIPQNIVRFLNEAQTQGDTPEHNDLIPREARYEWNNDLDAALSKARETERPAFVVLYRRGTKEWSRIEKMLDRPEVFRRFQSMVHARVTSWVGAPKQEMQRFNVSTLPALVIAQPDGTSRVLQMPTNYESIVRFADEAMETAQTASMADSPDLAMKSQ